MKCQHCGNDMLYLEYKKIVLAKEFGLVYILHMDGVPYRIEETENPRFEATETQEATYVCPWCGKEIAKDEETIKKMMRGEQ